MSILVIIVSGCVWPPYSEEWEMVARSLTVGAWHAACAWAGCAWPDASAGGSMRRLTSSKLTQRARLHQNACANRKGPTWTEAKLWQALKGKRLGVSFRRQAVVGPFIVDFLATKVKLVVEVDGGYHVGRRKQDARRDACLRELGYHVIRVEAELVSSNTELALHDVRVALASLSARP